MWWWFEIEPWMILIEDHVGGEHNLHICETLIILIITRVSRFDDGFFLIPFRGSGAHQPNIHWKLLRQKSSQRINQGSTNDLANVM